MASEMPWRTLNARSVLAAQVVGAVRSYRTEAGEVHALAGVDMIVANGEVLAVVGPSGCGKTTLLHVLGGLDDLDAGKALIEGIEWQSLAKGERARLRRRQVGFVFQTGSLLSMATAAENVEVPLLLDGVKATERAERVELALDSVGLAGLGAHLPDQLSGGQQQRVGIARALVSRPRLLLADEPTGSLDSETARQITDVLLECARRSGTTVVIVTHDPTVAARADRVVELDSGRVVDAYRPADRL